GVALIPVIPFAADLRVAITFQRIQISFRVSMAVALGVRQIDEDGTDRHSSSLEAVLLAASTHQKIGCAMLRLVGFLVLSLMHRDSPAVFGPILGLFLREGG